MVINRTPTTGHVHIGFTICQGNKCALFCLTSQNKIEHATLDKTSVIYSVFYTMKYNVFLRVDEARLKTG